MTRYDYAVLVFYFAYMLVISWVFRRFVHNVSDYFRGGGKAVWWMVGGSAFMVQFSAWTFTGAASQAYRDGWPVMVIYVGNLFGFLLNAWKFGPKFRQLRVVTSVETIRLRFGRANEQVFTWLQLPFRTLQAAVWLNALGVFIAAVFGIDVTLTIVGTGIVVVTIAIVGGSWAVLAGDFLQMIILMTICLTTTILALVHLGGLGGFLHAIPASHLDLGKVFTKDFLLLWCFAAVLGQFTTTNNLNDAERYLCVKDSRHARWAALLAAGLFLFALFIWFVPPMAARAMWPELRTMFPDLKNPDEASFIAIARAVMPVGMLGLLISGIFASTMSTMDAGLNRNAGIFIKNFYQPLLRPGASDAHLLRTGKFTTAALGVIAIFVALKLAQLQDLNLFLLTRRISILIGIPILVPLLLGMIVKKTPPWSAWSTVLIGFICSLVIDTVFTADWAAQTFGKVTLDATSREYWRQSVQFFGNISICSAWFLFTTVAWRSRGALSVCRALWAGLFVALACWMVASPAGFSPGAVLKALGLLVLGAFGFLFFRSPTEEDMSRVETFFVRFNTPVDFAKEEGAHAANDAQQASVVGWLCVAYGTFVMLLALIPNPPLGRVAFLGCGGLVVLIGGLLLSAARKSARPTPP